MADDNEYVYVYVDRVISNNQYDMNRDVSDQISGGINNLRLKI